MKRFLLQRLRSLVADSMARIPKLRGAPLMRYYIEVLEGEIKDATGDEEED